MPGPAVPDCANGRHTRWLMAWTDPPPGAKHIHRHEVQICRDCDYRKELPCNLCDGVVVAENPHRNYRQKKAPGIVLNKDENDGWTHDYKN